MADKKGKISSSGKAAGKTVAKGESVLKKAMPVKAAAVKTAAVKGKTTDKTVKPVVKTDKSVKKAVKTIKKEVKPVIKPAGKPAKTSTKTSAKISSKAGSSKTQAKKSKASATLVKAAIIPQKPAVKPSRPAVKPAVLMPKVITPPPEPITQEFIEKMEKSLQKLKSEIIKNLISNSNDFKDIVEGDPKDFADIASDDIDRKMIEALGYQEVKHLKLIDSALTRIRQGKYGHCIKCEKNIPADRLEAVPYALMCIGCKSEEERRNR